VQVAGGGVGLSLSATARLEFVSELTSLQPEKPPEPSPVQTRLGPLALANTASRWLSPSICPNGHADKEKVFAA